MGRAVAPKTKGPTTRSGPSSCSRCLAPAGLLVVDGLGLLLGEHLDAVDPARLLEQGVVEVTRPVEPGGYGDRPCGQPVPAAGAAPSKPVLHLTVSGLNLELPSRVPSKVENAAYLKLGGVGDDNAALRCRGIVERTRELRLIGICQVK